jgi:hypothetical protein
LLLIEASAAAMVQRTRVSAHAVKVALVVAFSDTQTPRLVPPAHTQNVVKHSNDKSHLLAFTFEK